MGPFVGSGPDLFVVRDANDAVVDDPDLAFVSSDETVATVDQAGVLGAIAAGRTLITVTSPDAADPSGLAQGITVVVDHYGIPILDPRTAGWYRQGMRRTAAFLNPIQEKAR
ncbi:MAG TPA: Ig-like domain-containing protein [Gemmatimonadota bacterium]|nr:Ig-like domain-containing protein [Gemmatimonadota bacterium]